MTALIGLIPAYAGKTFAAWIAWVRAEAHPRVCGENHVDAHRVAGFTGSSPRVRGKQPRARCRILRRGLIPACAGKTSGAPVA